MKIGGKRFYFRKQDSSNAKFAESVVQYSTQQVLTQIHEHTCKEGPFVAANLEKRPKL